MDIKQFIVLIETPFIMLQKKDKGPRFEFKDVTLLKFTKEEVEHMKQSMQEDRDRITFYANKIEDVKDCVTKDVIDRMTNDATFALRMYNHKEKMLNEKVV